MHFLAILLFILVGIAAANDRPAITLISGTRLPSSDTAPVHTTSNNEITKSSTISHSSIPSHSKTITNNNGTTHHGATGCNILSMFDVDQIFSSLNGSMIDELASGAHEIWETITASGLFDSIDSSILKNVEDESKKLWDQLTDPDHVKHGRPRLYNSLAAGWNMTMNRATITDLIKRDDWDDGEGTRKVDFEHFDLKELLDLLHNVVNVKIMHGCMPISKFWHRMKLYAVAKDLLIECVAAIAPAANTCVQAVSQFITRKTTEPDPFIYTSCVAQVLNFVINLVCVLHSQFSLT